MVHGDFDDMAHGDTRRYDLHKTYVAANDDAIAPLAMVPINHAGYLRAAVRIIFIHCSAAAVVCRRDSQRTTMKTTINTTTTALLCTYNVVLLLLESEGIVNGT